MENIGKCEKNGIFGNGWRWVKEMSKRTQRKIVDVGMKTKKLGQEDPRRATHSLKVGLTLTIVSLFYYFQTTYDSFGVYAMWAIMTVVVVFEFSVGATIGKGLNRGLATLVAGALGVGAHHLASISGNIGEPIILGVFVFLQAAISTFVRFFPKVKARYDYGLLVFILTFALVSVSGFRLDVYGILDFAHKRLSTIIIGALACAIISIFVCPVWAGEDLHNLVAINMEKLGSFLEGFGEEYFRTSKEDESNNGKPIFQGYKSVLHSKASEETLANFARWEPAHGHFMYRHPWKQYLKVGELTRQCAYRIEALNGYLNSDIQVPPKVLETIKDTYTKISVESGKAMKELALAIKTTTRRPSANSHVENLKIESKNLKSLLNSGIWEETDLLKMMPVATVASLLLDIAICVEDIAESVHELASLAHFKSVDLKLNKENSKLEKCGVVKLPGKIDDCPQVAIAIDG
ncbi:hypothetical protein LguiA_012509 [Lonicera macranthoides]